MGAVYKPEAYNSVSPYLVVKGAQRMIDFLGKVFGARELRRYDSPDGGILHAEVLVDDSVIMMGDASDDWPANQLLTHVYVPDVDAAYGRALTNGATPVQAPERKPGDPDRRGSFKNFAGNIWAVGTQIAEGK
ncbi:MAG: VOC family protein [bacterium]